MARGIILVVYLKLPYRRYHAKKLILSNITNTFVKYSKHVQSYYLKLKILSATRIINTISPSPPPIVSIKKRNPGKKTFFTILNYEK